MAGKSNIEWCTDTWNPIRGCSRVSVGCQNCYAERQAIRQIKSGYAGLIQRTSHGPAWTGEVRLVPERLDQPLRWTKPRRVFVNSMSDLFHEKVADETIDRVFAVMAMCPQHTFQILTKRPERMREYMGENDGLSAPLRVERWVFEARGISLDDRPASRLPGMWPLKHVWLGVSVEDQATADERIPLLLQTPAAVRFVSYEPALAGVHFDRIIRNDGWIVDCLQGIYSRHHDEGFDHPAAIEECGGGPRLDWVIVGGESGHGARPCDVAWIRSTVEQCRVAGVACFVKQLGARPFEQVPSIHQIGSAGALAAINERRAHIPGWTLTHTVDGKSVFFRSLSLCDRKGGDPAEWPEDLRVREMPR